MFETDTSALEPWPGATISGIRDVILDGLILSPGLPGHQDKLPAQSEVDTIAELALSAIRSGRAIDIGHIPNNVIMDCGNRGGPLYNQGALRQPFDAPWVFVHTWESDGNRISCSYLVNPNRDVNGREAGCEVVEMQPGRLGHLRILVVGDRVLLYPPGTDASLPPGKYFAEVVPNVYRFIAGIAEELNAPGKSPEAAAAGNVLDPLMSALMLLNTDGVPRTTVTPSEKLNKARAKSGKPPIPPHEVVDSRLYVTVISDRQAGRAPQGGHHASPTPHIRRAHFRTLASGTRSFVRETLVRVTPEAREQFVSRRSHYEVG